MNLQSVYYRSLTVRKSEGSDIARENIGGERFCAYHFASSALCGIYFWHFMHTLDRLKFMKKSPLFFLNSRLNLFWDIVQGAPKKMSHSEF